METYSRRYNMAKIRSKKIKAVQKEYDWYKKKVVEMEKERDYDRSWDGKQICLLYTSPSPRDLSTSRMPSSA